MNKRIRELLLQVAPMAGEDGEYLPSLHTPEDIERFAELLVEEFRTVLADEYRKTPLECCGHFLRADEAIAEHFYKVTK